MCSELQLLCWGVSMPLKKTLTDRAVGVLSLPGLREETRTKEQA